MTCNVSNVNDTEGVSRAGNDSKLFLKLVQARNDEQQLGSEPRNKQTNKPKTS